jgi:hypothetical protein
VTRPSFLVPVWLRLGVLVGSSWVLALNFGDYLNRMAEQPPDLVALAALQLQMCLLPVAVGSALAAWAASRAVRGRGADLWATAAVSSARRVAGVQLTAMLPVVAAWAVYWVVSTLQFGRGAGLTLSLLAFAVSVPVIAAACALGQVLGYTTPSWLAAPLAAVVCYVGTAFLTAVSDDRWWQALGPGLAAGIPDDGAAGWAIGSILWFGGATAALLALARLFCSVPRRVPPTAWVPAVAALGVGLALVWSSGA